MYVLCGNEHEKQEVTKAKLKEIKEEILHKGFDSLSFSYMQSLRFIKQNHNKYKYWEKIFIEALFNSS